VKVPNATTLKAIKEFEPGGGKHKKLKTGKTLLADLNAGD
jgi:hypothetical protein